MLRLLTLLALLLHCRAGDFKFHFVHVPKSGGSSVTIYLRQYVGCEPPGFCCTAPGLPAGVCNETRLCADVIGCTRHEPRIHLLHDSSSYSVISVREPLQRAVSAFNYPGHHDSHTHFSPFIRDRRYQNVATKMLNGLHPYANTSITAAQLRTALSRITAFDAIIISEALRECITALFRSLPGNKLPRFFPDARVSPITATTEQLSASDVSLFRSLNDADLQLYDAAVREVCRRQPLSLCAHRISDKLIQLRNRSRQFPKWQPPEEWIGGSCKDAYFLHFPGHYKHKLSAAVSSYFKQQHSFEPLPEDVIIAFPYIGQSEALAARVYDSLGYPYINYLRDAAVFQRWWSKVGPLMQLLRSGNITARYVVVHDASDVLLVNSPTHIIDYFNAYDCDILMGTTGADWPPYPELASFESSVAPWSRHHAHITAGMFMARTDRLLAHMEDLQQDWQSRKKPGQMFNDQLYWRRLHQRAYPAIKADSMCKIFARCDEHLNSI